MQPPDTKTISSYVTDLQPEVRHGIATPDRPIAGDELSVGGMTYERGLGTTLISDVAFRLPREFGRLEGCVGLATEGHVTARFYIYADDSC